MPFTNWKFDVPNKIIARRAVYCSAGFGRFVEHSWFCVRKVALVAPLLTVCSGSVCLVAMTSASHAEGCELEPRRQVLGWLQHSVKYWRTFFCKDHRIIAGASWHAPQQAMQFKASFRYTSTSWIRETKTYVLAWQQILACFFYWSRQRRKILRPLRFDHIIFYSTNGGVRIKKFKCFVKPLLPHDVSDPDVLLAIECAFKIFLNLSNSQRQTFHNCVN